MKLLISFPALTNGNVYYAMHIEFVFRLFQTENRTHLPPTCVFSAKTNQAKNIGNYYLFRCSASLTDTKFVWLVLSHSAGFQSFD